MLSYQMCLLLKITVFVLHCVAEIPEDRQTAEIQTDRQMNIDRQTDKQTEKQQKSMTCDFVTAEFCTSNHGPTLEQFLNN